MLSFVICKSGRWYVNTRLTSIVYFFVTVKSLIRRKLCTDNKKTRNMKTHMKIYAQENQQIYYSNFRNAHVVIRDILHICKFCQIELKKNISRNLSRKSYPIMTSEAEIPFYRLRNQFFFVHHDLYFTRYCELMKYIENNSLSSLFRINYNVFKDPVYMSSQNKPDNWAKRISLYIIYVYRYMCVFVS